MIDYEKIITSIKDLYNSGRTQQEIAKEAGFKSNTKISELISGKRDPKNLTVETLCKLIKVIQNSNLTINGEILAESKKININSNNQALVHSKIKNNNYQTQNSTKTNENILDDLNDYILESNLEAIEIIKFQKLIKNFKKER